MAVINRVDPEIMKSQADVLDNLIGEWNNEVLGISRLKSELDAMWDGLANDTFNNRWENDLNKFNQLLSVLVSYRQAITEAAAKYEAYEAEIASNVKN